MRDLVIIGAGGFGRELFCWIQDAQRAGFGYRVIGFLDDADAQQGKDVLGVPVLGKTAWLAEHRNVAAALGVGFPHVKRKIVDQLDAWDIELPVIQHPSAIVGKDVRIGDGSILCPGVIVTTNVSIGSAVTLNLAVTLGHDDVIGDYVTLSPGANVSGYVTIGEGTDIGTGVAIVPGKSIGAWSIIGAGATVVGDLPGDITAVGSPAKAIKTRESGWHLR